MQHATLAIALSACLLALAGCDRPAAPPTPSAPAFDEAALQADLQKLAAAEQAARPEAVLLYTREIAERYAGHPEALQIAKRIPMLELQVEQAREAERLAGLWTYHAVPAGDGTQYSAYIYGHSAAAEAPELRLVLRRHPEWGQNSYLLLGDGAVFACTGTCELKLGFDGAAPAAVEASRAEDADPPAVFIEDDKQLFAGVEGGETLLISLPLADGRTFDYRFELGGYEPGRMEPEVADNEPGVDGA